MSHYHQIIQDHYDTLRGSENSELDSPHDFRPFYGVKKDDEDSLLKWLSDTLAALQSEAAYRTQNQFRNIMFYKGIHSLNSYADLRSETFDSQPVSEENRFVMNHILEFTHQKQSRLLRFSPTINTFPWNNEYTDKIEARLGKRIIDSAFYLHRFDDLLQELTLEAAICGESFMFFEWDEFSGETDLEVEAAEKKAEILNTNFTNEDGDIIDLKAIKKLGDHKIHIPLPFMVLQQPRAKWGEVDYCFVGKIKHIDEVKAENSHLTDGALDRITQNNAARHDSQGAFLDFGETVIEWQFFHRATRFVPKGAYAKFFNTTLIDAGKLPYSHGMLPLCRFTDYDDPINAHGRSFYESLKLPSVMINNMMKIAYRSYAIAAYPKLIMQQDSCNMYSMSNGPFVCEYAPGTEKPEIVSFKAVNSDFYRLTEHVENFMEKNSGTFGISRGEQPANARARSILNFYEEREQERESNQIRKYSAFIEKAARMVLANSVDFYNPADNRTLKIVGKNNVFKLIQLNEDVRLRTDLNVKVQRTTALSESKQGRIDQIATLSNAPLADQPETGLFTREQVLAMIEVGDTTTFFEMATAAAERAYSENEDMFEGLDVTPPQEFQAHLVDWNVHFQFMQSREFTHTQGIPDEVRKAVIDHMRLHEVFMYKAAKTNLAIATVLSQNPYFPCVYNIDEGELPLSQYIIMLQQPPQPPAPPAAPEGGGAEAPGGPPELAPGDVPLDPAAAGDIPPPDAIPQGEPMPESAPPPNGDGLPVA